MSFGASPGPVRGFHGAPRETNARKKRERMGYQGKLSRGLNLRETPGRHILNASSLKPQASSLKPQASSLKPQASSLKPQASSLKPQASSLKPQASSLKPQASSLKPQASSLKPQASSLKPQASSSSLKPQASRLDREPGLRPGLGRRNDHGPARPGGVLRLFGRICATDAPGSEHSGGPKGRSASPGGEYQLIHHRQA